MTTFTTLKLATAVAIFAAATTQCGFAASERKNVRPFTDRAMIALSRPTVSITGSAIAAARIAMVGEAENLQPFSRPVTKADALERYLRSSAKTAAISLAGESKNELPFTRPA